MHNCIYHNIHTCAYTYINMQVHRHIQTHSNAKIHIYINIHAHTHTYTHVYIQKYIYTHTGHTCMHTCLLAHTQSTHTTHSQAHIVSGSFSSFLIFPQYVMKIARISNDSRTERTFFIRCLREETCLKVSDLKNPLCPLRNLMISRSVTNAKKKNSQAEIKFISTIILQWRGLEGVEEDTIKICCIYYEISKTKFKILSKFKLLPLFEKSA